MTRCPLSRRKSLIFPLPLNGLPPMLRTPLFAWLGLTLILASGCSSLQLFGPRVVEADAKHPVGEILCIWEAAEGRGLDNHPCRGFGGQILFFAAGRKAPVKVNGDVRVYVFDNEGVNGDPSLPLHQFDFPGAAWNALLRPSNLGTSYQIFIPYTRKGQNQTTCSVRVSFTPEGGLPVYSKTASVDLPGTAPAMKPEDKQVVTVSNELAHGSGQGIMTADWSELIHNPESASQLAPSRTPGISLATHQQATRQSNNWQSLRQAADQANHVAPEEPPQELPATVTGLKLKRLHPLQSDSEPEAESDSVPESADPSPELSDSPVPADTNRRHPLADSDSE